MIKSIPHTKLGRTANAKLMINSGEQNVINSKVDKLTNIYHNFSEQNK
jgi:hypothetical protein